MVEEPSRNTRRAGKVWILPVLLLVCVALLLRQFDGGLLQLLPASQPLLRSALHLALFLLPLATAAFVFHRASRDQSKASPLFLAVVAVFVVATVTAAEFLLGTLVATLIWH